jgi:CRP-like cAMP-binding protein
MQAILESVPIFAGLSTDAIELLSAEGIHRNFDDGTVVFTEDKADDSIFIIESGQVRILKRHGQKGETLLTVLTPNEFFGETCLLETVPHTATAMAVGPTTLFSITGKTFYHLYKKFPAQYGILVWNIARDLSRRLRRLDEIYTARQ